MSKTLLIHCLLSLLIYSLPIQAANILNLSTKSYVGVNDQRQVAGFVITGSGMVRVVIKAQGPSLIGVTDTLDNPQLTLKNAITGEILETNDNWRDGNIELITSSNSIPADDREAVIVADLPSGSWTAMVEGVDGSTGIALVSIKEISIINSEASLLNLSTKSFVGVNDQRQVAGMVVKGEGTVRVLIKVSASSLQNVQGKLENPQLTLKNALTGEVINFNDDWQNSNFVNEVRETGSQPSNNQESALVVELSEGNWTAMVEGVANSTGVALVSVKILGSTNPLPPIVDTPVNTPPSVGRPPTAPVVDSYFWQQISKDIIAGTYSTDNYLYRGLPVVNDCIAGEISDLAKQRMITVFNEIRQLHHLATLGYHNTSNQEVQEVALVQRANNTLTHAPASNLDCYTQLAFDGSANSNLHSGSHQTDPASDLIGWINDANNVADLEKIGHRRAMLNPFMGLSSYGQVDGFSALKVLNFNEELVIDSASIPDYVAFPFGKYPYLFFSDKESGKPTPWSLSIIEDKTSIWANQYDYFSEANVTVTHKNSGEVLAISHLAYDTEGRGVPNNLTWQVTDWQYDTWYSVNISNIQMKSGIVNSIRYDVFIDYSDLIDLSGTLEAGDQLSGTDFMDTFYMMTGTLVDANDKDSYQLGLVGEMTFLGESQFSNMGFYINIYDDETKQLVSSFDETTTLNLDQGIYTVVISDCHHNNLQCYSDAINYTVTVQ